jgi:hypothetical protein
MFGLSPDKPNQAIPEGLITGHKKGPKRGLFNKFLSLDQRLKR